MSASGCGLAAALRWRSGMLDWQTLIAQAPLGHKPRNTRAASLVAGMLQGHAANSHGATAGSTMASPADTLGAYRFLDHEALSLPRLYQPLQVALRERTAATERLYVLHDLSPVDYTRHHRKEDLCPIGDGRGYGYELFSSLVLNAEGKPLGSSVVEFRTCRGHLSSQSESVLPFVDHYDQVERATVEAERILPGRQLVHVADREFDELRLMQTCSSTLFVFHAQHLNRQVRHGGQLMSLRQATHSVPLTEVGTVERRVGQGQQRYTVRRGETSVTMKGPSVRGVSRKRNRPQPGQPLRLHAVVTELRAAGHKTLRWILLTNLQDSIDQVVLAYLFRWKIERLSFCARSASSSRTGIRKPARESPVDWPWCSWRRWSCTSCAPPTRTSPPVVSSAASRGWAAGAAANATPSVPRP